MKFASWAARTVALQLLALVASAVALFVNWRSVYAFGTDASGSRMTLFQGDFSLLIFTECSPRSVSGSPGVFTSCFESFSTSYSLPSGYTADFLNKNNTVLAFVVLTVIANLVAVWRAAEAWGDGGAAPEAPPRRPARSASPAPPGPAFAAAAAAAAPLALSAVSAVTALIAWAVFASIAMDDQAFYGSQAAAYPGGAEVIYGPGYALLLLAWVASLGGVAAARKAGAAAAAAAGGRQPAEGEEGEETVALAAGRRGGDV